MRDQASEPVIKSNGWVTQAHRARQDAFALRVERSTGWTLKRRGGKFEEINFEAHSGSSKLIALVTIKCRDIAVSDKQTFFIDESKFKNGVKEAVSLDVDYVFAIEWKNNVGGVHVVDERVYRVEKGSGRTNDTREAADIDDVVHIPISDFTILPKEKKEPTPKKPIEFDFSGDRPAKYMVVLPDGQAKAINDAFYANHIHATEKFMLRVKGTGKVALEAATPEFEKYIREVDPKVIIGAGATALSILKIKGTVKMRGTIGRYILDDKSIPVFPTHAPGAVFLSKSLQEEVNADVARAQEFANGEVEVFDKDKLAGFKLTTITSIAELDEALAILYEQPLLALDTETRGLIPWEVGKEEKYVEGFLVTIQIAWTPSDAICIPIHHRKGSLPLETVRKRLHRFFWDYRGRIVGHNLKFDAKAIYTFLGSSFRISHDTMIANSLLTGARGSNALKQMAYKYLDLGGYDAEMAEFMENAEGDTAKIPLKVLARYGMLDAIVTYRIFEKQKEVLDRKVQRKALSKMLAKLSTILTKVEMAGIRIDWKFLKKYEAKLVGESERIQTEIRELAGLSLPLTEKTFTEKVGKPVAFNFASSHHIGHLLYERMGLMCPQKTPGGANSVAKGVLTMIEHPIAEKFLELSSVNQNLKLYVRAYPKVRHGERIHPAYYLVRSAEAGKEHGTVSGRTSVSGPNIQQLPRPDEDEEDAEKKGGVRSLILPDDDKSLLVDCDFQTIEYRVAAMYCQDPTMIEFFNGPSSDYHLYVASEVFGKPPEKITKEERSLAKNVNFALLYGAGVPKISKMTKRPEDEVVAYIKKYFARFPLLDEWRRSVRQTVENNYYVVSMLGRKRYLREAKSTENKDREYAVRTGLNHLCQSTAADICFAAICKVDHLLKKERSKARMVMTIHDSVVFSVPLNEINIVEEIRTTMEDCDLGPVKEAGVRIGVDAKAGVDYGNLLPISEVLETLAEE